MKTKLQLLLVAFTILIFTNVKAETIINSELNLNNPDVRKCLMETSENEGWKLASTYLDSNNDLVFVLLKGNDKKIYISK